MNEIIISSLFLVFILIREKQHSDEVKLLSKAVIAKNVYEIKDSETDVKKEITPETSNLVPEDEASDEAFMGAIKKQLGRETPQGKFKEKITKLWQTR